MDGGRLKARGAWGGLDRSRRQRRGLGTRQAAGAAVYSVPRGGHWRLKSKFSPLLVSANKSVLGEPCSLTLYTILWLLWREDQTGRAEELGHTP